MLVFCEKSDGSDAAIWAGVCFAVTGAGKSPARLYSGCDGRSMVNAILRELSTKSIKIIQFKAGLEGRESHKQAKPDAILPDDLTSERLLPPFGRLLRHMGVPAIGQ